MKKKGMLLASEVLKMILAVIGIGFLIYLLTSIYFANQEGKDRKEAESIIGRIREIIPTLDGINKTSEIVGSVNPSGWLFVSYTESEQKPNSCLGKNCLCICDDVYEMGNVFGDRQFSECNKDGICEVIPNLMEFGEILIQEAGETSVEIYRQGNFIGVREI